MKTKLLIAFIFCNIIINKMHSQCAFPASPSYTSNITLTTAWQGLDPYSGDVYIFSANLNDTITFSYCDGGGTSTFNTYITLFNASNNPMMFADDECSGLNSPSDLYFIAPYTGTYKILLTDYVAGNACFYDGVTDLGTLAFKYTHLTGGSPVVTGTPVPTIGPYFVQGISPVNNSISITGAPVGTSTIKIYATDASYTIPYASSPNIPVGGSWLLDMGVNLLPGVKIWAEYYDNTNSYLGYSNDYEPNIIPRPQWLLDGGSVSNPTVTGNSIQMNGTVPLGFNYNEVISSSVVGLGGRDFKLLAPEFLFDINFNMANGISLTANANTALTLNTLGQNITPWSFPFSNNPFPLDNAFELNPLIIDSVSYNPISYKCNFPSIRFPITPGVNVKVDAGVTFDATLKGKLVLGISGSNFGFINSGGHVSKVTAKVEGTGYITTGLTVLGGLASASGILTAQGRIGIGIQYEQFPSSNATALFGGDFSVYGTVELKSLWGFGPEKTFGPLYFYGPQTFGPNNYSNMKTISKSYNDLFGSSAKTYSINGTMVLPSNYPMPSFGTRGSMVYPVWVERDMLGYGYLRIGTLDTISNCITPPKLVIKNQNSIANPQVGIMPSGDGVITWSQNRYTQATLPSGSNVNNLRNASDIWLGIYHAATNSISDTMMITDFNSGPESGRAEGEARIKMGSGNNGLITWVAKDAGVGVETTDIWFTNISQTGSITITPPSKLCDLPGTNKEVTVSYVDATTAFAIWINDPDGLDSTLNNNIMQSVWNGTAWSSAQILAPNLSNDVAYEEISMEYNYGYCVMAWTSTQYYANGDFDKSMDLYVWDNVAGVYTSTASVVGGNSFNIQKPRVSVSNTGMASVAYKVVDLYNDPFTPDPGQIYMYVKDLNNSSAWTSITGNSNISDPNTNVWELNTAFSNNNKFYTLTQEYNSSGPVTSPSNGVLFGDPSASMVLRGTTVNSNLTITDTPEPCNSPTGIEKPTSPFQFELHQNYPNPFEASTIIEFRLPKTSKVTLSISDLYGRTNFIIVNDEFPAGIYQTLFEPKNLSAGVYNYTMKVDDISITKKMILIK